MRLIRALTWASILIVKLIELAFFRYSSEKFSRRSSTITAQLPKAACSRLDVVAKRWPNHGADKRKEVVRLQRSKHWRRGIQAQLSLRASPHCTEALLTLCTSRTRIMLENKANSRRFNCTAGGARCMYKGLRGSRDVESHPARAKSKVLLVESHSQKVACRDVPIKSIMPF